MKERKRKKKKESNIAAFTFWKWRIVREEEEEWKRTSKQKRVEDLSGISLPARGQALWSTLARKQRKKADKMGLSSCAFEGQTKLSGVNPFHVKF